MPNDTNNAEFQNKSGEVLNDELSKDKELLSGYDAELRKKQLRADITKMALYAVLTILGAWYFGNMLFGKSSLETMISLKNTKKELNSRIEWLKEQNARKQKEFFELKGLAPE